MILRTSWCIHQMGKKLIFCRTILPVWLLRVVILYWRSIPSGFLNFPKYMHTGSLRKMLFTYTGGRNIRASGDSVDTSLPTNLFSRSLEYIRMVHVFGCNISYTHTYICTRIRWYYCTEDTCSSVCHQSHYHLVETDEILQR